MLKVIISVLAILCGVLSDENVQLPDDRYALSYMMSSRRSLNNCSRLEDQTISTTNLDDNAVQSYKICYNGYAGIWRALSLYEGHFKAYKYLAMDIIRSLLPVPSYRKVLLHTLKDDPKDGVSGPIVSTADIFEHALLFYNIYNTFQYYINNLNITNFVSSECIIKELQPFKNNISGLSVYKTGDPHVIQYIYMNQSEKQIDTTNLELAVYVPYDFLNKLSENKTSEELKDITIRIILILNGDLIKGLWNLKDKVSSFIGISIPRCCKYSYTPFLKAYFGSATTNGVGNWKAFGTDYIDAVPKYVKQLCFLSQPVYFALINETNYFDSVKNDYCVHAETGRLDFSFINPENREKYYIPRRDCIDTGYKFRIALCKPLNYTTENYKSSNCYNHSSFTENNQKHYEMLYFCWQSRSFSYCNNSLSYITKEATSYVDIIIAMDVCYALNNIRPVPSKTGLKLLEKGLQFLEKDVKEFQITAVNSLIVNFLTSVWINRPEDTYTLRRFIHFKFNFRSPFLGFVIYKSTTSLYGYDLKFLQAHNASLNYSTDTNVNVIAYITKSKKHIANSYAICTLSVIYGNFTEYTNQTSKSDVVGAFCNNKGNIFNVFVRSKNDTKINSKEYYVNEGYSAKVHLKPTTQTMLYIFEFKNSICDPVTKMAIFEKYIEENVFEALHQGNKTIRNMDLLSSVAVIVTEDSQETHSQHSTALKILTTALSLLSLLGEFCIFLSALVIKGWCQNRIYSIQLSISVTGGTIFFLLSESYITQIGYVIFYFFLISQFVWMFIIAYLQYIRYVKVFEQYNPNPLKASLIGWMLPILITSVAILLHLDCIACNLCLKNRDIFLHFVLTPVCIIIMINTAIYVYVMVKISRSQPELYSEATKKAIRKAAIFLIPILGISWALPGILFIPFPLISLIGSYIFHIIASTQGFVVFAFVILIDEGTKKEWIKKCTCMKKVNNVVVPMQVANRTRN